MKKAAVEAAVETAVRFTHLTRLWIPSPEDFRHVDAIPVLGTGKPDLKRVKDLATELFGDKV